MATGAIIAGLLGAGGTIGGGLLASSGGGTGTSDIGASGFNPNADPLLNASTLGLLGLIGGPSAGIGQRSNPLAQLQNAPGSGSLGFSVRDTARLNNAISFVSPLIESGIQLGIPTEVIVEAAVNFQASAQRGSRPPVDEKGIFELAANRALTPEEISQAAGGGNAIEDLLRLSDTGRPAPSSDASKRAQLLQRAISAQGFGDLGSLIDAQRDFNEQSQAQEDVASETQPQVLEGIKSALLKISELQQNFPVPTLDQIEDFRTKLVDRQSAEFLERANVAGINPSGGLGQVQNDPQSLANAINLFGGIQNIGGNALTQLQQSLLGPLGATVQAGSVTGNLSLGSAQLAQDQALALAQLNAQQQASQNVSLGNAVASGVGGLANIFGGLAQQSQSNDQFTQLLQATQNQTPGVLNQGQAGQGTGLGGLFGGSQ